METLGRDRSWRLMVWSGPAEERREASTIKRDGVGGQERKKEVLEVRHSSPVLKSRPGISGAGSGTCTWWCQRARPGGRPYSALQAAC